MRLTSGDTAAEGGSNGPAWDPKVLFIIKRQPAEVRRGL
jgi:hypothetical protein